MWSISGSTVMYGAVHTSETSGGRRDMRTMTVGSVLRAHPVSGAPAFLN